MKLGLVPLKSVWRELSNDIHFTMVCTYNKKIMKIACYSYVAIIDLYRILLSQRLVENKTNYISFKSSLRADHNGTSHSFIPPTAEIKKQKAPRKHPPKLMYLCCISH